MYSRSIEALTQEEYYRLQEIQFYLVLYRLIKNFKASTTAVDLVQYVAKLTECNETYVSNTILNCIQKRAQFVPKISEAHILLYKAGYPIRSIQNITGSSNQKIYKSIKQYDSNPYPIRNRLSIATDKELEKLLQGLHDIASLINLW